MDVTAPEPLPPFPASIMDGYAVVASDGEGVLEVGAFSSSFFSNRLFSHLGLRARTVASCESSRVTVQQCDAFLSVDHRSKALSRAHSLRNMYPRLYCTVSAEMNRRQFAYISHTYYTTPRLSVKLRACCASQKVT